MHPYTMKDLRRLKGTQDVAVHIITPCGLIDLLDAGPEREGHQGLGGAQIIPASSTIIVAGRLSNCNTSNRSV
jgi:hypothetical protein